MHLSSKSEGIGRRWLTVQAERSCTDVIINLSYKQIQLHLTATDISKRNYNNQRSPISMHIHNDSALA